MILTYILSFSIGVVMGLIFYHWAGFNDDRVKILLMKLHQKEIENAMLNQLLHEQVKK